MELDRFDRELLNLVQHDAGRTAEQLAERVPLSASAIQRRLKRLREEGVIEREIAVLDPRRLGRGTTFIASLQVERERPDLMAQLRQWLIAQDAIQQVFYVTGEADFVLVIHAADIAAYDALMAGIVEVHPNIHRFSTNVALSVVKRGLAIPIAPDGD